MESILKNICNKYVINEVSNKFVMFCNSFGYDGGGSGCECELEEEYGVLLVWEIVGGEVFQFNKFVCFFIIFKGEGEIKELIGYFGNNWEIKNNICILLDRKFISKINSDYIWYYYFNSIFYIMVIFRFFIYICENVYNLVRRQCIVIFYKGVVLNFCLCVIYMYIFKLCFIFICLWMCL